MLKKKLLSLLLALVLLCGLMPAAMAAGMDNFQASNSDFAGKFTDLAPGAWYEESVKTAYELGLVLGTSDTTFSPDGSITVGSALALACRLHSIYQTGVAYFEQGSPWYQVYVDYALANGIITQGQFTDYSANATRRQFAAILAKALPAGELTAINTVNDGDIPDLAAGSANYEDIYTLYRAGVLTGSDKYGTFAPETTIGRSSVAAIVARMAVPSLRQTITLEKGVSAITLDKSTLSLTVGGTAVLTASLTPADATDTTVTWSSSNTKVATVSAGTVTAVAQGSATITATAASGVSATCAVTVETRKPSTSPLFENGNVSITFNRIAASRYDAGEAVLYLDVKNKTGSKITVQADAVALNGYTFNDLVMSDDVSANATGTVEVTIQNFDASLVSLNSVETVGGQFRIILGGVGSGSETTYALFPSTDLYTGETDSTVPAVSGSALYSDKNVEIYFDRAEAGYDSDELEVYLTVRNKTGMTVLIQNDTVVVSGRSYDRTIMSDPVLPHTTGEVNVSIRDYTGPGAGSVTTIGGDFRIIDDLGDNDTYTATLGGSGNGGGWVDVTPDPGEGSGGGGTGTGTGDEGNEDYNYTQGPTQPDATYPGFPDVPDFGAINGLKAGGITNNTSNYQYDFYIGPGGFTSAEVAQMRNDYLRKLVSNGFGAAQDSTTLSSGGVYDCFVKGTDDGRRCMVTFLYATEPGINYGFCLIGVSYY